MLSLSAFRFPLKLIVGALFFICVDSKVISQCNCFFQEFNIGAPNTLTSLKSWQLAHPDFPTEVLSHNCLTVSGTLQIDTDLPFAIEECDVTLMPNAIIEVLKNKSLKINNSVFHGCVATQNKWYAIKNYGKLVATDSEFTDAYAAIQINAGSNNTINWNSFSRNQYGIQVSGNGYSRLLSASIANNFFSGIGVWGGGTTQGISVDNTHGFRIGYNPALPPSSGGTGSGLPTVLPIMNEFKDLDFDNDIQG